MSHAEHPATPLIAPLARTARPTLLTHLVGALSPPVFPGDELRTMRAYFLNVILLLKLATQLLAPFLWSGSLERRTFMTMVWTAVAIIPLYLLRRGHVRLASVIHLTTSWLLVTFAVATCGGVRAPGFSAYILIAGSAGLLLGWQALIGSVLLVLLCGVALLHAESTGLIDPSATIESLPSAWLTASLTFIVAAVHIGMAMRAIRLSRERIDRELAERKRTEEKLREHQLQLQSLSSRLLLIEERQRRSFSQMLHDHIGQNLTFAKLKLGELNSLPAGDTARQQALADLKTLLDQMVQETRSLTYELSPPLLYEIGLDAALEWLGEHFQSRYGLPCTLQSAAERETLEIESRIVLFQSARELLFNVVKHAHATNAEISVARDPDFVRLSVRDNGVGFDAQKISSGGSGFGLFNVRERMQHSGGELKIESNTPGGTCATLVLPVKR
jgi:signal transduction histidine kinase